jgi:hypothetical protein
MSDTVLSAFARAWATTVIAMSLLIFGLALARTWDGAIYVQLLEQSLDVEE